MPKKTHTTYIDKQQEQKQEMPKQQQGGGSKRPNQLIYLTRVAWRFYSKMLTETFLAAILVAPFYLYFLATGVTEVTIPVNPWLFLAIATEMFLLQSFMFGNK